MSGSDHIQIDLPVLPCRIGVLEGENDHAQPVAVRARLDVDLSGVMRSGQLSDTVDYARVHSQIRRRVLAERWELIESLAAAILSDLLVDARVTAAAVEVEKCAPPLGEATGPVTIRIARAREQALAEWPEFAARAKAPVGKSS